MKIYYLKWGEKKAPPHGVNRGYKQILQGLQAHPDVTLVDRPEEAEAVFIHHYCFRGDAGETYPGKKTVYFDMSDDGGIQGGESSGRY